MGIIWNKHAPNKQSRNHKRPVKRKKRAAEGHIGNGFGIFPASMRRQSRVYPALIRLLGALTPHRPRVDAPLILEEQLKGP